MPKKIKNGNPGIVMRNNLRRQKIGKNTRSEMFEKPKIDPSRLESVTDPSDLQICMERKLEYENGENECNVQIVSSLEAAGVLSLDQKTEIYEAQKQNQHKLKVPRRPKWDEDTTKQELEFAEQTSFRKWCLRIGKLAAMKNITITPFENNLEVWRQFWRVLEKSDIVVQIVDGRNPLLFRCKDVENYTKEIDPDKVNLLLVNKSDHLTEKQRETWAAYFNGQGIYAVFFSALESAKEVPLPDVKEVNEEVQAKDVNEEVQAKEVNEEVQAKEVNEEVQAEEVNEEVQAEEVNSEEENEQFEEESLNGEESFDNESYESFDEEEEEEEENVVDDTKKLKTISKVYNRDELIELFQNICPKPKLLQYQSYIGMVGYPNVGKSSTINCLLQKKKVTVSATPGKTKHFQTHYLTPSLVLCDCPGLVFPGFASTRQEMVIWGVLPIDRIRRDYTTPVSLLCNSMPRHHFEDTYSISLPPAERPPTPDELLSAYAVTRGMMSARGRPDVGMAGRKVLKDFMNGVLLYCVAPPDSSQEMYHVYEASGKEHIMNPKHKTFMPETELEELSRLHISAGVPEEPVSQNGGKKARRERVKRIKGATKLEEMDDGSIVEVALKPWRNQTKQRKGKINVNIHQPYQYS